MYVIAKQVKVVADKVALPGGSDEGKHRSDLSIALENADKMDNRETIAWASAGMHYFIY